MRKIEDIIEEIETTKKLPKKISIVNDIIQELVDAGFNKMVDTCDAIKRCEYFYKDTSKIIIDIDTEKIGEYLVSIYGYREYPFDGWGKIKKLSTCILVSKEKFDDCMEIMENTIAKIIFYFVNEDIRRKMLDIRFIDGLKSTGKIYKIHDSDVFGDIDEDYKYAISSLPHVIKQCLDDRYTISITTYKPLEKQIVLGINLYKIDPDDYPIKYGMIFNTETNILRVMEPNNMCNLISDGFVDRKIVGIEKISDTEYKITALIWSEL